MRTVDRKEVNHPGSLKKNAEKWKGKLLEARKSGDKKTIKRAESKYSQQDVKEELKRLYGDLCCFCETTISTNSWGNIEHRRPKSKYPKSAFEWKNLNWACTRCNGAKGDKWSVKNPILDPSVDKNIIPSDICIEQGLDRIDYSAETERGKTTICHADLNRPELSKARFKLWLKAVSLKQSLMKAEGSPAFDRIKKEAKEMTKGDYGSVLKIILGEYAADD